MILDGQAVAVTGAGSGLGAATARRLAGLGAKVACIDLAEDAAVSIAEEIDGVAATADVSDADAVESAFSRIVEQIGAPRVVVSCAGIGTAARILPRNGGLSTDVFDHTLRIKLLGTFIVMSVAARAMSTTEPDAPDGARGVIINTASVAYQDGQIGQAAYSASKGGVASMTLPAARELARLGIRVMTIAPGLFETAMSEGLPDDIRAEILQAVPFPSRMGQAEEYARLVQSIIENPMLNGTVIRLDAAARMPIK